MFYELLQKVFKDILAAIWYKLDVNICTLFVKKEVVCTDIRVYPKSTIKFHYIVNKIGSDLYVVVFFF